MFYPHLGEASSHTYYNEARLFSTEKFSRTATIHPRIFRGRALWADTLSPRMNTVASRDQSKPISMGENLVVNYLTN